MYDFQRQDARAARKNIFLILFSFLAALVSWRFNSYGFLGVFGWVGLRAIVLPLSREGRGERGL